MRLLIRICIYDKYLAKRERVNSPRSLFIRVLSTFTHLYSGSTPGLKERLECKLGAKDPTCRYLRPYPPTKGSILGFILLVNETLSWVIGVTKTAGVGNPDIVPRWKEGFTGKMRHVAVRKQNINAYIMHLHNTGL